MSEARIKLPPELEELPLFVLFDVIKQANLGETDMQLIQRYLVHRIPQADLAAELGWSRATVSIHITKAIKKMAGVAGKLYIHQT